MIGSTLRADFILPGTRAAPPRMRQLPCRSASSSRSSTAGPMVIRTTMADALNQHLLHSGEFFTEPELYCWMREKSQSSAEVDYLISVAGVVVPVEVKAGKTGTLKSLHVFLREKQRDSGLRLNTDLPSLLEAETCVAGGGNRPFRLLSLPLYLVEQVSRLCRDCLQA